MAKLQVIEQHLLQQGGEVGLNFQKITVVSKYTDIYAILYKVHFVLVF